MKSRDRKIILRSMLLAISLDRPADIFVWASMPGFCLWLGWWGVAAAFIGGGLINAHTAWRKEAMDNHAKDIEQWLNEPL